MTNIHYQELLFKLKKYSGEGTKHQEERNKGYIGSTKFCYGIRSGVKKQIIKDWIKKHKDLSFPEYLELLNLLYQGNSHEEISLAGKLLELLPKLRKQIKPKYLDAWLNKVEGWAEVDSICQSNFSSEEVLTRWEDWVILLKSLVASPNVHKRRASLVLLTKTVRDSGDSRLSSLAFKNIDKLKKEKDILITKAISWLLRDLIKSHRREVETYLGKNEDLLPKIAIRETRKKLLTGKKN
ncbi:MAG TPA: DNA alkylation repair protein [Patescibacteria group bacterium]|nr:DNA alkylation repair protein [Patescibacteria group bacterium]